MLAVVHHPTAPLKLFSQPVISFLWRRARIWARSDLVAGAHEARSPRDRHRMCTVGGGPARRPRPPAAHAGRPLSSWPAVPAPPRGRLRDQRLPPRFFAAGGAGDPSPAPLKTPPQTG